MPSEITTPAGLQQLYGSFWNETYETRSQPESLATAGAELSLQAAVTTQEIVDAASRGTIRPTQRERWFPVTVSSEFLNQSDGGVVRFGTDATFGGPEGLQYGRALETAYRFPAPPQLHSAVALTSRITNPGRCWMFGIDVRLEDGELVFAENPLDDPNVAVLTLDDGVRQAVLWLQDAEFDRGTVYEQYGYVHGTDPGLPGAVQKAGVAAISDAVAGGTNLETIRALIAAGTGAPRAGGTETIEVLGEDARGRFVATDKAAYRLPPGSTFSRAIGSQISAGEFLTDDVHIQTFSKPIVPSWLPGLLLRPGVVSASFKSGLALPNERLPVTTKTVGGKTHISFPLGGPPEDVERFFDEIHARGLANGQTLAEAIVAKYGFLPTDLNPLEFFIETWLRGALIVVRLTSAALHGRGSSLLQHLPRLTPPHALLIVLVDFQPPTTRLTISETRAGQFTGSEVLSAPCTVSSPRHSIRVVATNCE